MELEIYAYHGGYVYFDLTKHSSLRQVGATFVARVESSKVTVNASQKISLVHSGYTDNLYLQNFKAVGRYSDLMRSNHRGVKIGEYTNPSYAPSVVANKSGEWRYIGYNAQGEPLDNPYFISDAPSFQNICAFYGYPFRYTPWNPNDTLEAGEVNQQLAYNSFATGGKTFKYDTDPKYKDMKDAVINRLVAEGHVWSNANNYATRLSLRTFPTKQPTILLGQRKDNVYYRVGFMPLTGGLRDLYMRRITVTDEETNAVVAEWTCGINGGCSSVTGEVEFGKRYRLSMVLANGANSAVIKDALETQVGFKYNASSVNMNMPYANTEDKKVLRMGSKGYMYHTVNSLSREFEDTIYISKTGTIDIYGYVGGSHTGVDNLRYDNDLGVIRLNVKNGSNSPSTSCNIITPTATCSYSNNGNTKVCGGGDLRPYAIKIFSRTEGGKLVYLHNYGEASPVIREALIPGYEYRIVYNVTYSGTSILEYEWIPAVQDNPNTPNVDEYVPGRWGEGKHKDYQVPIDYSIEKYSGGPRDLDAINRVEKGFEVLPDFEDRSDVDIPLYNGVLIGLYADIILYEHPYLKTVFSIDMENPVANQDECNDEMIVVLNDNFDISLDKLTVTPSSTYTDGNSTKVNYNVTYDATLNTPSYVTEDLYQASINTAIKIGDKTYYVKDQLVKGSNKNKNITHVIEGVDVSSLGQIQVSVNLNYDKMSYETGDYTNNLGSTNVGIIKIKNPVEGSVTDTVKTPDSLNSNNPNKGGDANNNCLTPRTRNTWTSTHRKFSWNSSTVTYNKISTGEEVSFKKYHTTYENLNEATETYSEEFGIQKILFRSKETKNKNYGVNGWVNLLDSEEKDLAIVKAGYGFEIQIVTKYSTDALTKRTWNISNNGSNGTMVSALNGKPNYGLEDIFVELPGSESTRKILSSTGYGTTTLGLNSTKKVSGSTVEWTYTIKPTNTLNERESDKIFIPYETKDGDYTLKIYTPPVSGVTSVNKKQYSALCDRKEVVIKVQGSAINDLNSHETQ